MIRVDYFGETATLNGNMWESSSKELEEDLNFLSENHPTYLQTIFEPGGLEGEILRAVSRIFRDIKIIELIPVPWPKEEPGVLI